MKQNKQEVAKKVTGISQKLSDSTAHYQLLETDLITSAAVPTPAPVA
jgi:hypothetical protein